MLTNRAAGRAASGENGTGRQVSQRSFPAFRSVMALILREMSTRYGRSPGGYIWAILDPLGTTLMLALAMSMLVNAPPLGVSFVLFKATGMMPFAMYSNISVSIAHSIQFSKPLLRYPGVSWIDTILARLILNVLTTAIVAVLIFGGVMLYSETRTLLDMPIILLSFSLAALLGLGLGAMNIYFFMRFPAWEHTWGILNRPMFLAAGVLFLYEQMPSSVQVFLWYNPLVHILALMREGFYPMYSPDWVSVPYVLCWALLPMVLGLIMVRRHHVDLLNL